MSYGPIPRKESTIPTSRDRMSLEAATLLGIDLTASPKRASTYALLNQNGAVIALGTLETDADILRCARETRATLVAVDCPLGLPQGLCCLEESCDCQPTSLHKGRSAERELARMGIGSYFTTKRSIIKTMVYRGIALKASLEAQGCQVLEVYPYASKVCLFGKPLPKKTTPEGLAFLNEGLLRLMPSLAPYQERLTHDLADALMAAYTAHLYLRGETIPVGTPEEVPVMVPKGQERGAQ